MPFESASRAYAALGDFRRRRERQIDFTFGRQWNDTVTYEGRAMTEAELCMKKGTRPLVNNLIRQLVKTVTGRMRQRLMQEREIRSESGDPIGAVRRANSLDELDSRLFEEFLISGSAVQRIVAERRPAGTGVWVDNVDPSRFFTNRFTDPRGCDMELAGMIHDMSFSELAGRFGRGREGVDGLRRIYGGGGPMPGIFGHAPSGRCRVVEVWTLDSDSDGRLMWMCRWYSPDGTLIDAYPSPWAHGSHPFAVKLYPLTAGEVHSLVEDVICQQKAVNRLTTLIDHVIGTSAKGVLLFPISQLAEGWKTEQVAEQWATPDGVIPFEGQPGAPLPQQLVTSNEPSSAYHLLDMELRLMQQVSGVSDALAGRQPAGNGNSAALYEAQLNASTVALLDTFAAFDAFRESRDAKVLNLFAAR